MRFIGSKARVLPFIRKVMEEHDIKNQNGTFCDIFAGTASVAKMAKEMGFSVISNDNLYFSYCLQKTFIETNSFPSFSKLIDSLRTTHQDIFPSNITKKTIS